MSKKRSWLGLIKRIFFHETHQQQKITRRRRWLFGRLKRSKTLPSPSSPPSSSTKPPLLQTTKHEDDDDGKQHSKNEEDVVKDHVSGSESESETELREHLEIITTKDEDDGKVISLISENESTCDQIVAAITIQTAYRCYLAKKALRALKGFVRLQAIIRGTTVRRQAMITLKRLQSIAKIQSQVCARRGQMIQGKDGDLLMLQDLRNQNSKIQLCNLRRLDDELLSKEEEIDIILRKKEAILRSKKIKAYSFNHRHSADAVLDGNTQGRLKYWLEQYVSNDVVPKKEDLIKAALPRSSFHTHRKQDSSGEQDGLNLSSPTNLPTYMAATESAKARVRSTNSPRLRPIHLDAYSDNDSPYKQKFSPMSSINSEATCSGYSKVSIKSSFSSSHQKSPSFKGVSGPIRSNKNLK